MFSLRLWITGLVGAGKTRLADEIRRRCNASVLHLGEACRREFGEDAFAADPMPHAPDWADTFVKETVLSFLSQGQWGLAVIDGYPRKAEQVQDLDRTIRGGHCDAVDIILWLHGDAGTRLRRMAARAGTPTDLDLARLEQEAQMQDALDEIERRHLPVVRLNTAPALDGSSAPPPNGQPLYYSPASRHDGAGSLVDMMEDVAALVSADQGMAEAGIPRHAGSSKAMWMRLMVQGMAREVEELRREIPVTVWNPDDVIDFPAAREELVDVLHFVLVVGRLLGLDGVSLAAEFHKKLRTNIQRMADGWKKDGQASEAQ